MKLYCWYDKDSTCFNIEQHDEELENKMSHQSVHLHSHQNVKVNNVIQQQEILSQ